MAIYLDVEGTQFDDTVITSAVFESDTPDDSNARSQDLSNTLLIKGKILTANDAENTKMLATWSNTPQVEATTYKSVYIEVKAAGKTMRKITFPNAFVVDYTENFFDTEGVGTFELKVRQKKDKLTDVDIQGNY